MKRLVAVLASAGVASRRKCDELIKKGLVYVNGHKAELGQKVADTDNIKVIGSNVQIVPQQKAQSRLLIYNKKEGEICSYQDQHHSVTVFDNLPKLEHGKWINVGRLDLNSSGLLLFTNDGVLANNLMHPSFNIDREYLVKIQGSLDLRQEKKIVQGCVIEGTLYKVDKIKLHQKMRTNTWYNIILKSGKNKEIRKLMNFLGHQVNKLIRIRYYNIELPKQLKPGVWYEIHSRKLEKIKQTLAKRGKTELKTSK